MKYLLNYLQKLYFRPNNVLRKLKFRIYVGITEPSLDKIRIQCRYVLGKKSILGPMYFKTALPLPPSMMDLPPSEGSDQVSSRLVLIGRGHICWLAWMTLPNIPSSLTEYFQILFLVYILPCEKNS